MNEGFKSPARAPAIRRHWPAEPEEIGAGDMLRLERIGLAFPLREAYAQTHLA
jgi:hypothetical protein